MFEQILRNEKPYLLPKRLNCSKNIQCQGNVLRSGLCHKQHRVNTLSLYCCEQKLNQTNSILPFHLEEFWTLGGERSELIVLNRNERSVLLQLPHPNSFGLSWRGGTLQGTKMTSWVFARSYFGQLLCIIRSVCDKAEKRKLYIKNKNTSLLVCK